MDLCKVKSEHIQTVVIRHCVNFSVIDCWVIHWWMIVGRSLVMPERNQNILGEPKNGTMSSIPPSLTAGGDKTQGSNTIMSTSFALKFWSNEIIDAYPLHWLSVKSCSLDFIADKICAEIGAFLYNFSLFRTCISAILDNKKLWHFYYLKCPNSCRDNPLSGILYIHIIFS